MGPDGSSNGGAVVVVAMTWGGGGSSGVGMDGSCSIVYCYEVDKHHYLYNQTTYFSDHSDVDEYPHRWHCPA